MGLIAAVAAFYSPVVRNQFIRYDDGQYIFDNPHVNQGLKWQTVTWAFTSYEQANWHPLTWLSHALDCQLFGLNPAGHHAVNVLLHADQRRAPVSAAAIVDWISLAQPDGGGAVRAAPD